MVSTFEEMQIPSPAPTAASTDIETTLARARSALVDLQRPDGSWNSVTDIGPIGVATQLLVEKQLGSLPTDDEPLAVAYFEREQLPDGSFPPYPGATEGSVTTTALVWAALGACRARDRPTTRRAKDYVDSHGGFDAVASAFLERGDVAALYLLPHGHVDAAFLPKLPPGSTLTPLGWLLDRRVHAGNVMLLMVLAALGQRYGQTKRSMFGTVTTAVEQVRIRDYLSRWQNADGSWNGSPLQTTLMLAGLAATGLGATDPVIARALAWLDGMKRRGAVLDICAMDNDVWSTALSAMALSAAGEPREGPVLAPAYEYLLSCQSRVPMPRENQRKSDARRTGGWPFQRGNDNMPDVDDTGVVLAALSDAAGDKSTREMFTAIDDGVAWLRDMQNPDGGFPTFVWGLPSKEPGPMFMKELRVSVDDPKAMLAAFVRPAPEFGDPAQEGVTGRALWGLGRCGVRRSDPAVCRAVEFLRAQQCDNGAWWGRWKACYLAETATILFGLHAVGEDMNADYVQRALSFILSCQNPDGGFGEGPEAYRDPQLAGQGPSMPAVTAYVVLGCLAMERPPRAAIERAIAYLLSAQRDDGLWDNAGWLHTFIPPDLLYVYDAPARALPLLCLAEYRRQCLT